MTREAEYQLHDHLRTCPECTRRVDAYRKALDETRNVEPVRFPEEMEDFLAKGIRDALADPTPLKRPPADPSPERPAWQKASIFVGGVLALMAGTVGALVLFRTEGEPLPSMGEISVLSGPVEVRSPGAADWRGLSKLDFLPPGAQLNTGPDSLLEVRGQGVTWRLPGMASAALTDTSTAELVVGRIYARCDGTATKPVRLVTANGIVNCPQGELVASISLKRLRVACLSGTVVVENEKAPAEVEAGQAAMLVEGAVTGPIRSMRAVDAVYWLKAFDSTNGQRLSLRQLASVAVAADPPVLGAGVAVKGMTVAITVSGPLALVSMDMELSNDGAEPWEGVLSAGDVLLPPPLAVAGADPIKLEPGETRVHQTTAVCLMRVRNGLFGLGVNPQVWTANEIGRLELHVDASAGGGLKDFRCPTMNYRVRRREAISWSRAEDRFDPGRPIVLEFALAESNGVDCLWLEDGQDLFGLAAWRPKVRKGEWIRKGLNVFIAFDAAADFGAGGRAYAHEVLEVLLTALPPGSRTALVAYDGKLRTDPDPLMRHFPTRVETMLTGLWGLEDGAGGRTSDFLQWTLQWAGAAEGDGLLVFVTGRQDVEVPHVERPPAEDDGRLRLAVLQIGRDWPCEGLGRLASQLRGVALALPDSVPPELAALDFLRNLYWPPTGSEFVLHPPSSISGPWVGPGRFANQPLLLFVQRQRPGAKVAARLTL
ncbi:MAG: hypothetical protein KAX44_06505, partial [Candidatus Brocadiae bacterium]|nr:hypothetical protein [Candidatus Brocadiia bacterium]